MPFYLKYYKLHYTHTHTHTQNYSISQKYKCIYIYIYIHLHICKNTMCRCLFNVNTYSIKNEKRAPVSKLAHDRLDIHFLIQLTSIKI